MLNLDKVIDVYESEVCMRGQLFGGHQLYSFFHYYSERPRLVLFVIIAFYVTVFTVFTLSYIFIFSGVSGARADVTHNSGLVYSFKDIATIPQTTTASLEATSDKVMSTESSSPSTPTTQVRINGTAVPVDDNGSIHKDIAVENANASINISAQSDGSTSSNSSSSLQVMVNSSSQSIVEAQQ